VNYYQRQASVNSDGSPIFENAGDDFNERRVKARLEETWKCSLHRYPRLHAVDWYAERDQRVVGHVELKFRHHSVDVYPTVFLNFRKYASLLMLEIATGIPSTFVVAYSDGVVKWIRASEVPVNDLRMAGTARIVKSSSDREPIFFIPIDAMTDLEKGN
jgi:hypothetical protein